MLESEVRPGGLRDAVERFLKRIPQPRSLLTETDELRRDGDAFLVQENPEDVCGYAPIGIPCGYTRAVHTDDCFSHPFTPRRPE